MMPVVVGTRGECGLVDGRVRHTATKPHTTCVIPVYCLVSRGMRGLHVRGYGNWFVRRYMTRFMAISGEYPVAVLVEFVVYFSPRRRG